MTGSDKCRMHGGTAMATQGGARNSQFRSGKFSKVLKSGSPLAALYDESRSQPDIIGMEDHFALLDARVKDILRRNADQPVPEWDEFVRAVGDLQQAVVGGDMKSILAATKILTAIADSGHRWDRTWEQIATTVDLMRKVSESETKRKKDLGLMIPIERVIALMAAVGNSVKARVSNTEEVMAVFRDLSRLHGLPAREGEVLLSATVIDVEKGETIHIENTDPELDQ